MIYLSNKIKTRYDEHLISMTGYLDHDKWRTNGLQLIRALYDRVLDVSNGLMVTAKNSCLLVIFLTVTDYSLRLQAWDNIFRFLKAYSVFFFKLDCMTYF